MSYYFHFFGSYLLELVREFPSHAHTLHCVQVISDTFPVLSSPLENFLCLITAPHQGPRVSSFKSCRYPKLSILS